MEVELKPILVALVINLTLIFALPRLFSSPTGFKATAAAAKKRAAGPVAAKGPTCTARTLEGRQCTFRVTAGGCFCKKHSTMV